MKMFRKKEDGMIDNLLRAYVRRQSSAFQVCQNFDPDLANAYIERRLTTPETARYERHLSECGACRKGVIALARMVELDAAPRFAQAQAVGSVKRSGQAWLTALVGGALPQWALAAAAVAILVAGVSLLLISGERLNDQSTPAGAVAQQAAKSQEAIEEDKSIARENEAVAAQSAPASRGRVASESEQEIARDKQTASSKAQLDQAEPAKDTRAANPQPPQTQAVEAGSAAESDAASVIEGRIAAQPQAPAPAPAADEQKNFPRIDPAQALRLPREDEKSTQVSVLKPGTGGTEPKTGKEEVTTIRPQDNIAPPPATSTPESRARRLAQPPPGLALRSSNSDDAAPAPGATPRRIKGKRFWLLKEVWTDNDYKPNKELPEVTLVRDSDVYNEVLTKRGGLKPYFTGFDKSERVVIVYKGTVYKLIPQE